MSQNRSKKKNHRKFHRRKISIVYPAAEQSRIIFKCFRIFRNENYWFRRRANGTTRSAECAKQDRQSTGEEKTTNDEL